MVIQTNIHSRRRAILNLELAVAVSILVVAVLPLAFMFAKEGKLLRSYYRSAVAMEILDGEMEVLAAGEWQRISEGKHVHPVSARSATNLPPGQFMLIRDAGKLRLQWVPQHGTVMQREVTLP